MLLGGGGGCRAFWDIRNVAGEEGSEGAVAQSQWSEGRQRPGFLPAKACGTLGSLCLAAYPKGPSGGWAVPAFQAVGLGTPAFVSQAYCTRYHQPGAFRQQKATIPLF